MKNPPAFVPAIDPDDIESNSSSNETFDSVLQARLSRRGLLRGGIASASTMLIGGLVLQGCGGDDAPATPELPPPPAPKTLQLTFNAIAKNLNDTVTVPAGYEVSVLYRLGDPLAAGVAAYANNGSEPGASFAQRSGDHHDGMNYFGVGADGKFNSAVSSRGLLCMNHENITQVFLHAAGPTVVSGVRINADEVTKEINAHGVAIFEVTRPAAAVTYVQDSAFNRRITPNTPMAISGPAAGDVQLRTAYSPLGNTSRGTINNCATGATPWGSFLTCEENWAGYFHRDLGDNVARGATSKAVTALRRYTVAEDTVSGGTTTVSGNYQWSTATAADPADTTFRRWNASKTGTSSDGSDDFRNEPNTFGYVVEIDPFAPTSTPRKRSALGRFAHEAAAYPVPAAGKPVVFYMGDDSRGEYIYKFVSLASWDPADATRGTAAGDKYLDAGTLYAAKFNADGTGTWLPLTMANSAIASYATYAFASQADICINTRLAADAAGATKMDRPEWSAVNPTTRDVYFTLTNNNAATRTIANADPANPRQYADPKGGRGNPNGHIIRLSETGTDSAATTFKWDVYLFGARSTAEPNNVNVSGLDATNDFSSPDGIWFDPRGVCWIQTDDSAYTDVTNCMMLAALPGTVGDGAKKTITNTDGTTTASVDTYVGKAPGASVRRFLVGPKGCEITGIATTPDLKTMFVNIQHPGEETTLTQLNAGTFQSNWPGGGTSRPRSSTIAITRSDGKEIGAESL